MRFALTAIVVIAFVTAALVYPRDVVSPESVLPLDQQRVVYVTDDFAIVTKRADGTGRDRIVGGSVPIGGVQAQPLAQQSATYTWPTWSPDGSRLVVSRVPGPGRAFAALMLIKPPSAIESALHTTSRGSLDRVADGAPHYPLWSPDGLRLALVAPNRQSTALLLTEASLDGGTADVIADGAPLYVAWSPDSKLLAVHHQRSLIIRDASGELFDTGRPSVRYRVPSFSADGASLAYVADVDGVSRMVARELRTGDERSFGEVPVDAVFAWSPTDAEALAIALRPDSRSSFYEGVTILDTATGDEQMAYERRTFAFWWSPDGTTLAVVAAGSDGFLWESVDVRSGTVTTLAEFIPTPDFLTYLQFFDQFARSHQVWSADSTALVFAGQMVEDRTADSINRAWVLDATGEGNHVPLGNARAAFFVPVGDS